MSHFVPTNVSTSRNPLTAAVASLRKEDVLAGFVAHYDDVARYASCQTQRGDEAGDIVQDAYLRVFRLPNPENIRTPRHFLFRLVRNLIVDRVRARAVRQRHAGSFDEVDRVPHTDLSPDVSAMSGERKTLLETAVAALPDRTREVFVLHTYAKMSYSEVAAHLALSKSAVAKHFTRAMTTIHAAMAAKGLDTP